MKSSFAATCLAWWMRCAGVICALALIPVVMPRAWHVAMNASLGLGDFPDAPLAEYLARGMSALCGYCGLLNLYLSRDVIRHRAVIAFQTLTLLAVVSLASTFQLTTGMPTWWIYGDLIAVWVYGIVALMLIRGTRNHPR